jgi:hypothetical protein
MSNSCCGSTASNVADILIFFVKHSSFFRVFDGNARRWTEQSFHLATSSINFNMAYHFFILCEL